MARQKTNPSDRRAVRSMHPVFLNCELISPPISFPRNSTITVLELSENLHGFSDAISSAVDPDGVWPAKESAGERIYRCRLENDGDSPIYAIEAAFNVIYKRALKVYTSTGRMMVQSGETTLSHDRKVTIPKVGAHGAFTFYIRNRSMQCVDVQAPESITCEGIKDNERSLVRLKRSSPEGTTWMGFLPVFAPAEAACGIGPGNASADSSKALQSEGNTLKALTNLGSIDRIDKRVAARRAVVEPILKKRGWARNKWGSKAGVGKNCPYEYLDGKRCLSHENRKAMAEVLGLTEDQLPND